MKLKNLVGLVFGCVILSVTAAHALYAENGNENYRNGQYDQAIQNYNTALSNGENSEQTYSTQVSKNNYMQPQKPQYEKKFGYGFIYLKDPYNNKFFVLQVINDSPAYKAGLRIGDELVKKDGEKLKKYSRRELSNLLANTNSGTFEIKNRSGEQIISITKAYVNLPVEKFENPHRDKYWNQISDYNVEKETSDLKNLSQITGFSSQMKNDINNSYSELNHWSKYFTRFKSGYDVCISNYGMDNRDSNACIMNVVDKTKADIAYDEEQARQQAMYEQQMRMQQQQMYLQQQQINAMNNYSNALQNQKVNVNQNVNYSGTVNHNINGTMNYNVNGNMNHYYRGWGW